MVTKKLKKARPTHFEIAGHTLPNGTAKKIEISVSRLPSQTMVSIPVSVIHGKYPGKCIALTAAVHGDELNGIEIIHRIVSQINPKKLHGTILAVPIVNVFGVLLGSRYLPDRRDLNRSFPGSRKGPLAARLANILLTEIISRCTYAIDFHTAALGRNNLPQIRANLDDRKTCSVAKAFGARALLHSKTRDGSLRQAAVDQGCKMLLFEAGAPNRFNESSIAEGTAGVLRVMNYLEMISMRAPKGSIPIQSRESKWVRANRSGIFRPSVKLGSFVNTKDIIGTVADYFGEEVGTLKAPVSGVVIGVSTNPIVTRGDALVHIAIPEKKHSASKQK
jgi:hypothetical protein